MPREAMPPTRMDQRAPNVVPTHPMSGDPIGVAPRNTREYRAMTRPRLSGSVRVCTRALALVFIVSMPKPVGIDRSANHQ